MSWGGRWIGKWLGLAALAAAFAGAPAASASFDCGTALVRHCEVQLDDSGRAWFQSYEKLTEDALGDGTLHGGIWQIYERVGNQTVLVSKRPDGTPIPSEGNYRSAAFLLGVSPDGSRVYFGTEASLVPEDGDAGHADGSSDVYVRANGAYSLLTTGPLDGPFANPNATSGSHAVWASDDGQYVYFETGQALVPEDWDGTSDVYQRANGVTRLVSTGPDETKPTAEWPYPMIPQPRFLGASPDGATAYFSTAAHLTAEDSGKSPSESGQLSNDIFAWRDGVLRRLTRTAPPGEGPGSVFESFDPYSFAGAAEEGSAYFIANSAQTPDDANPGPDIYRASFDGALERVALPGLPAGAFVGLETVSRDGTRFFLRSNGALTPEDQDDELDIYTWSAAAGFRLVTPRGPTAAGKEEEVTLCEVTGDGERAYFRTWGRLLPQDTDGLADIYEWRNGAISLVSPAASAGRQSGAFCAGASPNGRFIAFSTYEELVPGDDDVDVDIYVMDMGVPAAQRAPRPTGRFDAFTSRDRPIGVKRKQRRPRLITAESIAPLMTVARTGVLRDGVARLRLRCPRAERSGPCHGKVKLLTGKGRVLASGSFRIPAGRRASVALKGQALPERSFRSRVRVRGADLLGNRRTVTATVKLRRAG
ncbi:MAG TPA: hypothetical protein VHR18_10560 [Solirubrobacterales bacterium]|nr:hypothetical protein [Solirubrobacterales bacterium]